jgi:class 3 adenylate cyclase
VLGFTKWSSERSPNEVFKLLELLFWEFDDIAARLKIFKLGTIGDCYIAVTGIPEPVQDHAVLLTQFAFEARDKCREVCARLESEGLDTARLDMRFGIHSGDTTAGILRGTKSRFELFGDTINTASRMESTGLPGKIQVSEETARLIQRDSKSQWLTKRDTTITAKGKGEMQTYWAEPHRLVSFSDAIPADDQFLNRNQGLLRGSLKGSFVQQNSLSQWSETGESQEKDGPEDRGKSTPNSRRSSVELTDATVEDKKCDGDIDSDIDPDFAELMNISGQNVDAGSSADDKV